MGRFLIVRVTPRIYVADGFVTGEECDEVLDEAREAARTAASSRDQTGFAFELATEGSQMTARIADRIETALGQKNALGGTMRFRLYQPGESHPPHTDNFRIGDLDLIATAMLCLTDVDEGGATSFPRAEPPAAVKPIRGRLIVWLNNLLNGEPEPRAFHEGQPVIRGMKATITSFVYGDPSNSRLLLEGPAALQLARPE